VVEALAKLNCDQAKQDPALFLYKREGKTLGMVASHIDDFLHAGEPSFDSDVMQQLRVRFLAGKLEEESFKYIGFHISQTTEGITLDQTGYLEALEPMKISKQRALQKNESLTPDEQTALRAMVGKINWVVQGSRPDAAFDMIELSMRFKNGTMGDLQRAIKVMTKMKNNHASVSFPSLGDPATWKLLVCSDAALANLCDGVSSMGAQPTLHI